MLALLVLELGIWQAVRRLAGCLALASHGVCFVSPLQAGDTAEESGPLADFYSYLPAAPEICACPTSTFRSGQMTSRRPSAHTRTASTSRALKLFRRASDDGNIVADWYLGHMYRQGRGVQRMMPRPSHITAASPTIMIPTRATRTVCASWSTRWCGSPTTSASEQQMPASSQIRKPQHAPI